ncbi:hypothetical protein AN1V17_23240 [Vallitalea sediminicola]
MNCFNKKIPIGIANNGMICAKYVLKIPMLTTIKNLGIATATGTNIKAKVLILLNVAFPLNSNFDKAKAAHELIKSVSMITLTVTMILLNKYLDAGIPDSAEKLNNNLKFSKVGFFTKNLGGYANSSVKGLNALLMIKTIGNAIKIDNIIKNI